MFSFYLIICDISKRLIFFCDTWDLLYISTLIDFIVVQLLSCISARDLFGLVLSALAAIYGGREELLLYHKSEISVVYVHDDCVVNM